MSNGEGATIDEGDTAGINVVTREGASAGAGVNVVMIGGRVGVLETARVSVRIRDGVGEEALNEAQPPTSAASKIEPRVSGRIRSITFTTKRGRHRLVVNDVRWLIEIIGEFAVSQILDGALAHFTGNFVPSVGKDDQPRIDAAAAQRLFERARAVNAIVTEIWIERARNIAHVIVLLADRDPERHSSQILPIDRSPKMFIQIADAKRKRQQTRPEV